MSKWEYECDTLENYESLDKEKRLFLRRGKDGWELVQVVAIKSSINYTGEKLRFYWKRELPSPPKTKTK